MSRKSIEGKCPNCDKETLVIVGQFRDLTDWQMKYTIECEICDINSTSMSHNIKILWIG